MSCLEEQQKTETLEKEMALIQYVETAYLLLYARLQMGKLLFIRTVNRSMSLVQNESYWSIILETLQFKETL